MENDLLTDSFNSLLAIPSLVSSIVIVGLFSFGRWRALLLGNNFISGLIISLLLLNFLEILTYGNFYKNYDLLIRVYYCAIITSSAFFLCLSERLSGNPILPRNIFYVSISIFSFLLIILVFSTDLIVLSVARNSYTISRIPGGGYWAIQIHILFCIVGAPLFILMSIVNATNPLDKKRHIVILFSFMPIIVTALFILFLMQIGISINSSLYLPFSSLLFVISYLFTESKTELIRFLVNIPFSNERYAYKKLNDQVIEYLSKTQTGEKLSLKESMNEIEKIFIQNALELKGGDHNEAAELLNTSISTIYRNKGRKDK